MGDTSGAPFLSTSSFALASSWSLSSNGSESQAAVASKQPGIAKPVWQDAPLKDNLHSLHCVVHDQCKRLANDAVGVY